MTTSELTLQITGLGRKKMVQLAARAKRLGLQPERYVKELVEEDLALDREARTTTLAQLMGPGRDIDEAELIALVDQARTRHHRKITQRKKR